MLTWVGKRPLAQVTAFPAQHIETFDPQQTLNSGADAPAWRDWPAQYPPGGLLFHGDNKEVLAHLLANGFRGKVDLIYIDPPFDSGADYVRRVSLRSGHTDAKVEGEGHSLGEQLQYTDIWTNDNYLQFMYERLQILWSLLASDGALYLHCDPRKSHLLRTILDEIAGGDGFVSEIIWQSSDAQSSANRYGPIHNTIFYYTKGSHPVWNAIRTPLSRATADAWYAHEEVIERDVVNTLGHRLPKGTARRYNMADLTARKRGGDTSYEWRGVRPPSGRYWAYSRANMEEFENRGLLAYSGPGRPYLKRYLDEVEGTAPQDVWTDISMLRGISGVELSGYPTEKPPALLERIIRVSSRSNDIVLDCFLGSGTTAAVAQKLGRRWIGCDINKGAIQTTAKRLQHVIVEQVAGSKKSQAAGVQGKLLGEEENTRAAPAQLGFSVWRVNDYDLQIQHNEAVNLASEHLGIVRNKTDVYFDGTLGRALVKITPFDHPLTPLDLEELKRELDARPDEDRPITVVCLGIEIAARAWVEEWNRLRKGKNSANRLDVIELRTDERYGKFIRHTPAQAKVSFERVKSKVKVTIEDFLSPTIVERLQQQAGVLKPKIDDWRAMVDCVMIDPAYDGQVFNVAMSDVPERKTDLVSGTYELPVPSKPTTVAVKIIDMLGEEVVVTRSV